MRPRYVLLTCEHATNHVPTEFQTLFRGKERMLASHRGWDPGALRIARTFNEAFGFPLHAGGHCRLLADLNRSRECGEIFSEFTENLPEKTREQILRRYHDPHWARVRAVLRRECRKGLVVHLGFHSFTPVLRGQKRRTGIGILCDSSRTREYVFCKKLQKNLRELSEIPVHLNLPYRGSGDGLTHSMRSEFPERRFLGIEIEVNQKYLRTEAGTLQIAALLRTAFSGLLPKRERAAPWATLSE